MNIIYDLTLDATMDEPPWPMIKTKEILNTLSSGAILKVMVRNNDGTISNIRTLIRNSPYELLREVFSNEGLHFYIRKI